MASNTKIDVKQFSYTDRKTDIKLWLKRFKYAVIAILDFDATEEEKEVAYIRHLPPKLDDFCLQIFETSANQANWANLEAELIAKLDDPFKAQHFQDNIDSVKWDGECPLHIYENQITISTRSLHPLVAASDQLFEQEIFKRFVAGLPTDYQNFIDIGLPTCTYDIKKARERAEKWQELLKKNEGKPALAFWLGGPQPTTFTGSSLTGAAYKDNPVEAISGKMDQMSLTQRENFSSSNRCDYEDHDHDSCQNDYGDDRNSDHQDRYNYGRDDQDSERDHRYLEQPEWDDRHSERDDHHLERDDRHSEWDDRHSNWDNRHSNLDNFHSEQDDRHLEWDGRHSNRDDRHFERDDRHFGRNDHHFEWDNRHERDNLHFERGDRRLDQDHRSEDRRQY